MDLMQKRDELIELHEKYLKLFDELTNEVQQLSESKPELQTSDAAILRALAIVNATEWSGDIRVNMNTVIGAGRVLAKALAVTETNLCTEQTRRANVTWARDKLVEQYNAARERIRKLESHPTVDVHNGGQDE